MGRIPSLAKIQLFTVGLWIKWLNFWLKIFSNILFFRKTNNPQNILIHKIGNIGDIVCAAPSFIAIRRVYPKAKITLLTSSGRIGTIGAKELLNGVWYLNEQKIYYAEDINSFKKKKYFIKNLRKEKYDLFVQLPDDLADFRTLLRNMIFAKIIGAKSAFGFKIRTVQLFKKTQVDHSFQKTEVESLLGILKGNGVMAEKVEYDFNVSAEQKNNAERLLKKKWPRLASKTPLIIVSPGGKRETNQWPIERFAEVVKYLNEKYGAKIIVVGGKNDVEKAEVIKSAVGDKSVLITAGKLDFMETFELLKRGSFLISNSTGMIHLAAAAGLPCVGLYGVRDVFGRWFPYGENHKILYHKFLDCDYEKDECIKKSIEAISVEEAKNACGKLMIKT
ncbi:MAG: glycosyltransferase family 9 protein [Patescibacteria group bacterium]